MDLRVKKTEAAIKNAFLELRSKKALEKITIKELCEKAQIHKSTFYDHYADIYALSDAMETEIVASIVEGIPNPRLLLENPAEFTVELTYAYLAQSSLINRLFSGSRRGNLANRIEDSLKRKIFDIRPEYEKDLRVDVILTFCIQGGYWAYEKNREKNLDEVIRLIGELSQGIWQTL